LWGYCVAQKSKESIKIFDAIAAPLRFQILRRIYMQGSLAYSEIMKELRLNPSRDAGKFAYHLRKLVQAELIITDERTKKYRLSSLGNMTLGFSKSVEEQALKGKRKLFVRTSRLAIEEFDKKKIVNALTEEANVPLTLAQKVAEETEERLFKLDTLYLTAPLIREFVNAILIEKGFQEYRHKLTRLGLPVYDITQLIENAERSGMDIEGVNNIIRRTVMSEYVLLNILPRKVADAHLSGFLHVKDADVWVLKPDEFIHDLREFLWKKFRAKNKTGMHISFSIPKSLETALSVTASVINSTKKELSGEQVIPHFTLFIAPFIMNSSEDDVKEALEQFIYNLNQSSSAVSLGIDFRVPEPLGRTKIPKNKFTKGGSYADYLEENLKIISTLIDLYLEEKNQNPIINPQLIFNITQRDLRDSDIEQLLLKIHKLAVIRGTPYFVNQFPTWQKATSYSASGKRLSSDWTGDWELDTMRTGNLGSIIINLPRLAYEAERRNDPFFNSLNNYLVRGVDALKVKYQEIEKRMKSMLLPTLTYNVGGDPYFRIQNAPLSVELVGINEATRIMIGEELYQDRRVIDFTIKLLDHARSQVKDLSQESGFRAAISQSTSYEAAQRLAELDMERYKNAGVFTQGTSEAPYYTALTTIPFEAKVSLEKQIEIDSAIHPFLTGGHLTLIELGKQKSNPNALLNLTKKICQSYDVGAYTFTKRYSYCRTCQKTFDGYSKKCPHCKSMKGFIQYNRRLSKYKPIDVWPKTKQVNIIKRTHYRLS
jgi:anaerobic ribonucleoside-triphosphate reductase